MWWWWDGLGVLFCASAMSKGNWYKARLHYKAKLIHLAGGRIASIWPEAACASGQRPPKLHCSSSSSSLGLLMYRPMTPFSGLIPLSDFRILKERHGNIGASVYRDQLHSSCPLRHHLRHGLIFWDWAIQLLQKRLDNLLVFCESGPILVHLFAECLFVRLGNVLESFVTLRHRFAH